MLVQSTRLQMPSGVAPLDAAKWFRQKECRGWIQRRGPRVEAFVQGPRHHVSEGLQRFQAAVLEEYQAPPVYSTFVVFPDVSSEVRAGGQQVSLGQSAKKIAYFRLGQSGAIIGWAIDCAEPSSPLQVSILVDGEPVGEVRADQPTTYLAEIGLGDGLNGLYFRLPSKFLDSCEHQVGLAVVGDALLGKTSAIAKLPVGIPKAVRPWIAPPLDALESAKQLITRGDQNHGAREAMTRALVADPEAVFGDWGLAAASRQRGFHFRSMRERMLDRWGEWYGPAHCVREKQCCKLTMSRGVAIDSAGTTGSLEELCPLWPRFFEAKPFTKAFAKARRIDVPATYFETQEPELVLDDLPHRFVLKPLNDSGRGIFLMHNQQNLFDRTTIDRQGLLDKIKDYVRSRGSRGFIIEEFLVQEGTSEDYAFIPLDYKLHVFGGRVCVIHVDDRNKLTRDPLFRQQGWYSRAWKPSPVRFRLDEPQEELFARPSCLAEMIAIAEAIGREAGGTYLRVDLYATDRGPVLGEVTTYSFGGNGFTPMGDLIMSQLWELFEPDLGALPKEGR